MERTSPDRPQAAPVVAPRRSRRRPSQLTQATPERPASPPAPTPLLTAPEDGPRRRNARQALCAALQAPVPSVSGRLPWFYDVSASEALVVPCYNEPILFRPARYGFAADPSALACGQGARVTLQARSGLFNLPAGPTLQIEAGQRLDRMPAPGRIQVLAGESLQAAQAVIGPRGASVLFWTSSQMLALHCTYRFPHWSSQQQLVELCDCPFDMRWLERHGQRSLGVRGRSLDAQLFL